MITAIQGISVRLVEQSIVFLHEAGEEALHVVWHTVRVRRWEADRFLVNGKTNLGRQVRVILNKNRLLTVSFDADMTYQSSQLRKFLSNNARRSTMTGARCSKPLGEELFSFLSPRAIEGVQRIDFGYRCLPSSINARTNLQGVSITIVGHSHSSHPSLSSDVQKKRRSFGHGCCVQIIVKWRCSE